MIKFVVHPGYVISATDGDVHYIGFTQLVRLYRVNPSECVDVRFAQGMNTSELKDIYPRSRNYPDWSHL